MFVAILVNRSFHLNPVLFKLSICRINLRCRMAPNRRERAAAFARELAFKHLRRATVLPRHD
ncbi:hypothetical protein V1478_006467 [Vespula squamosa]|uniref:Uncharacterized protein n=1 Tax=Vespula squamosa TaxID=30214 RepID=A0ABD2B7Z8_VESSQ